MSNTINISRQELFNIMKNCESKLIDDQFLFVREVLKNRFLLNGKESDFNKKISHFKSEFKSHWNKVHRIEERFIKDNENWLKTVIQFTCLANSNRGCPVVLFESCSERTKKQKTQNLRQTRSVAKLSYATQMSLRASGKAEASKLVNKICTISPKRAYRYRKAYRESQVLQKLSGEDALVVLVDAKVSRHKYDIIRMSAPEIFPSYKIVQSAKKECYPNPEYIRVTTTSAEVTL